MEMKEASNLDIGSRSLPPVLVKLHPDVAVTSNSAPGCTSPSSITGDTLEDVHSVLIGVAGH